MGDPSPDGSDASASSRDDDAPASPSPKPSPSPAPAPAAAKKKTSTIKRVGSRAGGGGRWACAAPCRRWRQCRHSVQGWRQHCGVDAPQCVCPPPLPLPLLQVWWKVAIVVGVLILVVCITAAMLFWDCCKLRSSWKAAVSAALRTLPPSCHQSTVVPRRPLRCWRTSSLALLHGALLHGLSFPQATAPPCSCSPLLAPSARSAPRSGRA